MVFIFQHAALRLIRRHERCSSKLARYTNHLTFLTKCIKNRDVRKDLRARPPGLVDRTTLTPAQISLHPLHYGDRERKQTRLP